VALPPTNDQNRTDKLASRKAAEQDVLLREVDDAVRQDRTTQFAQRYGVLVVAGLILVLAAFGAWLWWDSRQEGNLETGSEELVMALDQLEAGNRDTGDEQLAAIAENGAPAAAAGAAMLRAGILIEQGENAEAAEMLFAVADDGDAPEAYRNLAAIRAVAANFDSMEPQQVVERLKPLATPGTPWFGSAGELVAMAYLKQGNNELAGPLFASIAKDEDVPQTLRSRTRQMAGMLGYDAVVDVDQAIAEAAGGEPAAQ
jgi:hypothetical protein